MKWIIVIAAVAVYISGLNKMIDRAMSGVQQVAGVYSLTAEDPNQLLIRAEKTSLGFTER